MDKNINFKRGPGIIKVLHVDDEPALIEITRRILEKNGDFEVTTFTSAVEGLVF